MLQRKVFILRTHLVDYATNFMPWTGMVETTTMETLQPSRSSGKKSHLVLHLVPFDRLGIQKSNH